MEELSEEIYKLIIHHVRIYYKYLSLYELYAYDASEISGIAYDKEIVTTTPMAYDGKVVELIQTRESIAAAFRPIELALEKIPEKDRISILKNCIGKPVPHSRKLLVMKKVFISEVAKNMFTRDFLLADFRLLKKYRDGIRKEF